MIINKCLLLSRKWRKVGEHLILWSKLNLTFNVFKVGRGSEEWEGRVDKAGRVVGASARIVDGEEVWDSVDICGWTEELEKVLTLPRLQSLEQLTLSFFFMGQIFWEDCIHFLQLVSDFAPSVRKLSWREGSITVTPNTTPVEELAQQLVEKLVKFEEVDFSFFSSFDEDFPHFFFPHEDPPRFGNGINAAVHRALAAASFDGEESRLKVLTLDAHEPSDSAALVEARKKLTVNFSNGEY